MTAAGESLPVFQPAEYYMVVHRIFSPPARAIWRPYFIRGSYIQAHLHRDDAEAQMAEAIKEIGMPERFRIATFAPLELLSAAKAHTAHLPVKAQGAGEMIMDLTEALATALAERDEAREIVEAQRAVLNAVLPELAGAKENL